MIISFEHHLRSNPLQINYVLDITEIVLLTKKPRQATVTASGVLKVLALERATFRRVFGNLDEIMKRNMEEYNKYAASGI